MSDLRLLQSGTSVYTTDLNVTSHMGETKGRFVRIAVACLVACVLVVFAWTLTVPSPVSAGLMTRILAQKPSQIINHRIPSIPVPPVSRPEGSPVRFHANPINEHNGRNAVTKATKSMQSQLSQDEPNVRGSKEGEFTSSSVMLPSFITSLDSESLGAASSTLWATILQPSGNAASSTLWATILQPSGNVPFLPSLILNSILFFSLRPKLMTMLTPAGFAHSLALGTILWTTLGWRGWTVCVLYLFLGQLVTKVGFDEKEAMGIAEKRGGRRGPENVWGSALTGVLCASAAAQAVKGGGPFWGLSSDVWILGYVASLATKLADTFASEIGKAFGKTTFLITTLKPVPPGTEGAVSLEGTLASVVGGLLLPLYAYLIVGLVHGWEGVRVATLAAFVATMIESLIGATMQEKEGLSWMTNEVVNFFNTLIGAVIAMVLGVVALGM